MKNKAVELAVSIFGSQANFAKELNIKPQNVQMWVYNKRKVPIKHCLLIETLTKKDVTCEELRPDIDWKELSEFFKNR